MSKETKLSGNVTMKNQEDQRYYDALLNADFLDINDIMDMRNIAVIKNGKVTYPFYDESLEDLSPVYDEKGQRTSGIEIPHRDLLVRRLADLARDGELYFFKTIQNDTAPYKIEFAAQPDGKITASLNTLSLYSKPEKFQAPEKPAGMGWGHWLLNKITFGWAFSAQKQAADEEENRWKEKMAAHEKTMRDRETFVNHKKTREAEDQRAKERADGRSILGKLPKYRANFAAIYGPKPKKTGLAIDPAIDVIDPATEYELPAGISEDMAACLVKLALADPQVAELAVVSEKKEPKEDLEKLFSTVEGHGVEDVFADRIGFEKKIGPCLTPARKEVKEALDAFRLNQDPAKIGKIIGQGIGLFSNNNSFNTKGLTDIQYAAMKTNAAILDMLDNHERILAAARQNGLTDKNLLNLRAQKNICEVYENDLKARKKLLTDFPQTKQQRADDFADYLLGKMANNMIIQQTKDREKALEKCYDETTVAEMAKGTRPADIGIASENAGVKLINHFESTPRFDLFGKKTIPELRGEIQNNKLFRDMLDEMEKGGKNLPVLNDQAKLNRLINSLDQEIINPANNAPENAPSVQPIRDNTEPEKEIDGFVKGI